MSIDANNIGFWMVVHMVGAMLLGWVVGYERYFSGRAAGSQVYCLVSTTSCAITLLSGCPTLWYWGTVHDLSGGDPTRVINAIMTGIGFLGAGIIVQSGMNVRGLTTAASIWGSAAIGILIGVGFYSSAIGLTCLFVASLALVPRIEHRMPAHAASSRASASERVTGPNLPASIDISLRGACAYRRRASASPSSVAASSCAAWCSATI